MFVSQVSLNGDDKALNELGAGGGAKIPVELSANGLVGVKQVAVTLTVSPAEAFDLAATTFAGSSAFSLSAPAVEVSGNQVRGGAVVNLNDDSVSSDSLLVLGTFTLVTSDSFTEAMEADIVVHGVSLGPFVRHARLLGCRVVESQHAPQPAGPGAGGYRAAGWQCVDFWGRHGRSG